MQKITPFLWFDNQAEEAANFYASVFKNSKILDIARYGEAGAEVSGRPQGTVMTVEFELEGQRFVALNGGPIFRFTPAASFLVGCNKKGEVDALWGKLSEKGMALMELGEYPFSEKYGWIQDRYGLSWQLMFMGDRKIGQKITPTLMFVGEQCGNAEEAIKFYTSVFKNAEIAEILRYGQDEGPDKEGTVKHAAFTLESLGFAAMDSAYNHSFTFSEAISFMVNCQLQEEIDVYWRKLSVGSEAEQCGWLKDKYGVSWQIVPRVLSDMLQDKDAPRSERVMAALLKMKKLDIETLKQAYEQR